MLSLNLNGKAKMRCVFKIFIFLVAFHMLGSLEQFVYGADVLWDCTHGVYYTSPPGTGYQPSGRHKPMIDDLTALNIQTTSVFDGLLNWDLNKYQAIVVSVGSSYDTAYSGDEVDALFDYVNNRGGLLIMSDNSAMPNHNIQPVADLFDVTLQAQSMSYDGSIVPGTHQILEGVGDIIIGYGGGISSQGPLDIIGWGGYSGAPALAAGQVGLGRVVVIGDINVFTDDPGSHCYSNVSNQIFAENLFNYLVPEPTTIVLLGLGGVLLRRKRQ